MSDNRPFSERMGITLPKAMQIDDLDRNTRMALYNVVAIYVLPMDKLSLDANQRNFWQDVGADYFYFPRDKIFSVYPLLDWVYIKGEYSKVFFDGPWDGVFDFIEHISHFEIIEDESVFSREINDVLEKEKVGYKFISRKFMPITNEEEAKEIKQAVESLPYKNAREHLQNAIELFADRENPKYANSIKESIIAVESLSRELTGKKDFSVAVRKLKDDFGLHGAFAEALIKMYGYTSDEAGIRHGKTKESLPLDQATARYMLVICSAVVNFIADKATN